MIDVHCLVHKESKFFPSLKVQMEKEEGVTFHIVRNGGNIGLGRVKGFLLGSSPYVSFVDYDDLISPGIFRELNSLLERGYDWVYTNEVVIDELGNELQPGWSSNPELYRKELLEFMEASPGVYCHHIVAFKRSLLKPPVFWIMTQLAELAESYLFKELGRSNNFYHLDKVGYYWRIHGDNGFRNFASYRHIMEVLNV